MASKDQDDAVSSRPASTPDIRTGFISGNTFGPRAVQYEVVNGLAIFEGDIIIGTVAEVEVETELARQESSTAELVATSQSGRRWPDGLIPWEIDSTLTNTTRVTDAVAHWQTNTIVKFTQRTPANAANFPNFVTFRPGTPDCNSSVGCQGGQQFINLDTGCLFGQVVHEIGHAVGLWHEQSRADRDLFVSINWVNIQPGKESNYNQHISDGTDVGDYDYGSIMHYGPTDFGVVNPVTGVAATVMAALKPLPPGVTMGQRTGLSAGDIVNVNRLYNCLALSGEIDELELEIFSLQDELRNAGPGEKAGIVRQIKALQNRRKALAGKYASLSCDAVLAPA